MTSLFLALAALLSLVGLVAALIEERNVPAALFGTALGLTLVGALVCFLLACPPVTTHRISLVTSGQNFELFVSEDGEMMAELYRAINDAIAARG